MMDSVELYWQLLGLTAPWTVDRVELDVAKQHVEVHVGHPASQRFSCPECGRELGVYDHQAERVWRHLDSCQFLTYLHARPPRVSCPEHGVRQVTLPWAQAGSRFTNLFEALAVDVLLAANVKRAAAILRITWDEAWRLMERAVIRGRAVKGNEIPEQMGVDEKAIAKGRPERFEPPTPWFVSGNFKYFICYNQLLETISANRTQSHQIPGTLNHLSDSTRWPTETFV